MNPKPILLAAAAVIHSSALAGSSGTLLQFDFNNAVTWPVTSEKTGQPGVLAGKFGTIDIPDSAEPSGGLLLIVDKGAREGWSSSLKSGPLAVKNSEANLGKLTLAFSLSATRALPIRVVIESYNSSQERTGGLLTTIHPAAADFHQRFALDLSTMKSHGDGAFDPSAPFVGFTFELSSDIGWPAATRHELRLDNIHYAKPSWYVKQQGNDSNDGRTEETAFANPQQAVESAGAGDIIVVMDGTYPHAEGRPKRTPVAKFLRPGAPGGWITLKNYPGHKPILSSHGQEAVNISWTQKGTPEEGQKLSYIEVRGLHVRGNGDTAKRDYPDEIATWSANTNSQGIVVNGRSTPHPGERTPDEIVHHIRLADNLVELCTADGVYVEYADWLYVENNRIINNCWTTHGYAPAGMAVMGYANFDTSDNVPKMLVSGNQVSGNRLEVMNQPYGKKPKNAFFNGNGMLFDANAEKPATGSYLGRTLVMNNLVYNNGAAGIQLWANHRMDIVNNTVYQNGTVLRWGQIGFERSRDVRLFNNIIVGREDTPLDSWFERMDTATSGIIRSNNLYLSGSLPNVPGINDLVADPQFVNPSSDPAVADFRLKPASPALKAGRWELFSPVIDLDGNLRPTNSAPDIGAFQH
jgi:parallel beta-helix repeat protein